MALPGPVRYAPEFERHWNYFAQPDEDPWRVEETQRDDQLRVVLIVPGG